MMEIKPKASSVQIPETEIKPGTLERALNWMNLISTGASVAKGGFKGMKYLFGKKTPFMSGMTSSAENL